MDHFAKEYHLGNMPLAGWKRAGGWVALGLLIVSLAACQPGSVSTANTPGSAATSATPTHQAPIHVPPGYQGLVEVTFTATTTYTQAIAILQSAGLQAEVACSGPGGPPGDSPPPTSQQRTFEHTHQLSAAGVPRLSSAMLAQIAAAPQVVSVGIAPKVACPV